MRACWLLLLVCSAGDARKMSRQQRGAAAEDATNERAGTHPDLDAEQALLGAEGLRPPEMVFTDSPQGDKMGEPYKVTRVPR